MKHLARTARRVGAGGAVLAMAALLGIATPAQAKAAAPDLFVSFTSDPVAEVNNAGMQLGVYVYNQGDATATSVKVKYDASGVSDDVAVSLPEWGENENCTQDAAIIVCEYGTLEPGQTDIVYDVELKSVKGAAVGGAGDMVVSIEGAEEESDSENNSSTFPVTVIASGPDLVAAADGIGSAQDRVGPGDTAPLLAAVFNDGDEPAPGFAVTFSLPYGATFAEQYSDCVYLGGIDRDPPAGYIYGPTTVTCVADFPLAPGEGFPLFDPESGEAIFNAVFGKNLRGPEEIFAYFETRLPTEDEAAKLGGKRAAGDKTFAKEVGALAKVSKANRLAAAEELDTSNNLATFSIWSKANTIDVEVTVPPVAGEVGQTVTVKYTIVNNGPSDGGGPAYDITAPSGTVLVHPGGWCRVPDVEDQPAEATKLRCVVESEWLTIHSGYGRLTGSVQVKIKSTPGTDGAIHAENIAVQAKESNPANNTAAIVITQGGTGGGLPVTGPRAGLVAGAGALLVAAGVVALVMIRRRRIITVVE
ncbi:CARDB domain-containing protein [Phytohabitans houttuyneae]|nr:CARDB domain-containing protein [Phytohabitans houttuyneae]